MVIDFELLYFETLTTPTLRPLGYEGLYGKKGAPNRHQGHQRQHQGASLFTPKSQVGKTQ